LLDTTTTVIGSMIGSGVFLKASGIAEILPSPGWVMLAWVLAGILTLFGALSFAELGAMFPASGGIYAHLREAYGDLVAFLFGWSLLAILQTGSIAGLAAGIALTAAQRNAWIEAHQALFATLLIVGLSAINALSVRAGVGFLQNALTFLKCAGIVMLIVVGWASPTGTLANFAALPSAPLGIALLSALGMVMMKTLWAYDGWVNATFLAGEVKDCQRTLPRALLFGTLGVIAVYLAINGAYHYALSIGAIQASKSVAVLMAQTVSGENAGRAVTILLMISMAGTLNSSILTAPRVYYAMARDGLFFPALSQVHPRFLTPFAAILVQAAWALALLLLWKGFDVITDNVIFVFWVFYALGAGAVLILRRTRPEVPRPFRVPGYPFVPLVFIVLAILLIANTVVREPKNSAQALGLLAVGLAVYPFFRGKRRSLSPDQSSP